MKIAFDARYLGKSGIGRVCEGILDNLDYDKHEYYLIGDKEKLQKYDKAKIYEDYTNPFSGKGILTFNKSLNLICDALIVPNFIIPIGVKIPTFTIMHDLIFLDLKKTCKNFVDKQVKKYFLKRCMKKSKAVSCVSEFTLKRCEFYYGKLAKKCFVNYNGLSGFLRDFEVKTVEKEPKTLVFIGNVKKHKGLKTLVEAFKLLPKGYTLKIIGEKDNFNTGENSDELNYQGIEFTGKVGDEELLKLTSKAEFLIQPSEYEGFGIPPLEAICMGTKPIVSDIEVFKEVYDGFDVEFFKCGDAVDLKEKIMKTDSTEKSKKVDVLSKYDYKNTANNLIAKVEEIMAK